MLKKVILFILGQSIITCCAFGSFTGYWLLEWESGGHSLLRAVQSGNTVQLVNFGATGTADSDSFRVEIGTYVMTGQKTDGQVHGSMQSGENSRNYVAEQFLPEDGSFVGSGNIGGVNVNRSWTPAFAYDDAGVVKLSAIMSTSSQLQFAFRGVEPTVGVHSCGYGDIDIIWTADGVSDNQQYCTGGNVTISEAGARLAGTYDLQMDGGGAFSGSFNVPYTLDSGQIMVNIFPEEAVERGAEWILDNDGFSNDSGETSRFIETGVHTVTCINVFGYSAPSSTAVNVEASNITTVNCYYKERSVAGLYEGYLESGPIDNRKQSEVDLMLYSDNSIVMSSLQCTGILSSADFRLYDQDGNEVYYGTAGYNQEEDEDSLFGQSVSEPNTFLVTKPIDAKYEPFTGYWGYEYTNGDREIWHLLQSNSHLAIMLGYTTITGTANATNYYVPVGDSGFSKGTLVGGSIAGTNQWVNDEGQTEQSTWTATRLSPEDGEFIGQGVLRYGDVNRMWASAFGFARSDIEDGPNPPIECRIFAIAPNGNGYLRFKFNLPNDTEQTGTFAYNELNHWVKWIIDDQRHADEDHPQSGSMSITRFDSRLVGSYAFTYYGGYTLSGSFDVPYWPLGSSPDQAAISLTANPTSGGAVTGGGTYEIGSQQQISATASNNWHFVDWNDGNTQNPRTITVPSDGASYTANFARDQAVIALTASPTDGGSVSGGGTYDVGSQRQISASASADWHFVDWNDGSTQNPRTITVPAGGASYTANFDQACPIIGEISDQTIDEDGQLGPISFFVFDADGLGSLTLSATSSNTELLKASDIALGGSSSNRTISAYPQDDSYGQTTITVTVSDGDQSAKETFNLHVDSVNDPPVLPPFEAQTAFEDQELYIYNITASDPDDHDMHLSFNAWSDNPDLVPNSNLKWYVFEKDRTLGILGAKNANGTVNITVAVSDVEDTVTVDFPLTIKPVNDPPVISSIPDQTIQEGGSSDAIGFTVEDVDSPNTDIEVGVDYWDRALKEVNLSGSSGNRTIHIEGWPDKTFPSTVTVTASDGEDESVEKFRVNIESIDDPPTLSGLNDLNLQENGATHYMDLHINDSDTYNRDLDVSVSADDPSLVSLDFNWSLYPYPHKLRITPKDNQTGSTSVHVSVADDENVVTKSFSCRVSPSKPIIISKAPNISLEYESGTAQFHVIAVGTKPMNYAWTKNGKPYDSDGNNSILLPSIKENAGTYRCRVSNSLGTTYSEPMVLKVSEPDSPFIIQNIDCDNNLTEADDSMGISLEVVHPHGYQFVETVLAEVPTIGDDGEVAIKKCVLEYDDVKQSYTATDIAVSLPIGDYEMKVLAKDICGEETSETEQLHVSESDAILSLDHELYYDYTRTDWPAGTKRNVKFFLKNTGSSSAYIKNWNVPEPSSQQHLEKIKTFDKLKKPSNYLEVEPGNKEWIYSEVYEATGSDSKTVSFQTELTLFGGTEVAVETAGILIDGDEPPTISPLTINVDGSTVESGSVLERSVRPETDSSEWPRLHFNLERNSGTTANFTIDEYPEWVQIDNRKPHMSFDVAIDAAEFPNSPGETKEGTIKIHDDDLDVNFSYTIRAVVAAMPKVEVCAAQMNQAVQPSEKSFANLVAGRPGYFMMKLRCTNFASSKDAAKVNARVELGKPDGMTIQREKKNVYVDGDVQSDPQGEWIMFKFCEEELSLPAGQEKMFVDYSVSVEDCQTGEDVLDDSTMYDISSGSLVFRKKRQPKIFIIKDKNSDGVAGGSGNKVFRSDLLEFVLKTYPIPSNWLRAFESPDSSYGNLNYEWEFNGAEEDIAEQVYECMTDPSEGMLFASKSFFDNLDGVILIKNLAPGRKGWNWPNDYDGKISVVNPDDDIQTSIAHEFGHTCGLCDAYGIDKQDVSAKQMGKLDPNAKDLIGPNRSAFKWLGEDDGIIEGTEDGIAEQARQKGAFWAFESSLLWQTKAYLFTLNPVYGDHCGAYVGKYAVDFSDGSFRDRSNKFHCKGPVENTQNDNSDWLEMSNLSIGLMGGSLSKEARWVTPSEYQALYESSELQPESTLDKHAYSLAKTTTTEHQFEMALIEGVINNTTGEVDLSVDLKDNIGTMEDPGPTNGVPLNLRIVDAGDNILLDRQVQGEMVGNGSGNVIVDWKINWPEQGCGVQVLDAGSQVYSLMQSPDEPIARFINPGSNQSLAHYQDLVWEITDNAGISNLHFDVFYLPDGENAVPIEKGLPNDVQYTTFDTTDLPGTTNGVLSLRVWGGLRSSVYEVTGLSVERKAPEIVIKSLNANEVIPAGKNLMLKAFVADKEEGVLGGEAVHWTASQDGHLGWGCNVLSTNIVTEGFQIICVSATDSDGMTASNSVVVHVKADDDRDGMPDEWEMDSGVAIVGVSDEWRDPDGDGLSNLREYQLGTHADAVDTDMDGLTDAQEVRADSDPLDPCVTRGGISPKYLDTDKDGMSDYDELVAGTDPEDDSSYLHMFSPQSPVVKASDDIIIKWTSASNRYYKLWKSTNLMEGFTFNVATNIPATPPLNTYTDETEKVGPVFIYRIEVESE